MELTEYRELLDSFLQECAVPERTQFSKNEVLDILLDLRNKLPQHELAAAAAI